LKIKIISVLLLISVVLVGCSLNASQNEDSGSDKGGVTLIKQAELTDREEVLVNAAGSFREVRVLSLESIDKYNWIEIYIDKYDSTGMKTLTSSGSLVNKNSENNYIVYSITELNEIDESFWNVAFVQDGKVSKYNMPIKNVFNKSTTSSVVSEKEYVKGSKNIFAYLITTDNNEILAPTVDSLESHEELNVDENTVNYIFSYQLFEKTK
jgi:hypothetical protein